MRKLIKGGQGKSAQEIEFSAKVVFYSLLGIAGIVIMKCVGAWLKIW